MRSRSFRQDRQGPPADAGFTLVEVVVALVLLTMVATAAFMLFIRVLQSSKGMDSRTAAITVAQQAMDQARSVTPGFDATFHSKLVDGRQKSLVTTQFASPPVGVDVSQMYPDYDPTATASSTPVIPLTNTATVSNQTFNVATVIGQCVLTKSTGVCAKTVAGSVAPLPSTLAAGTTLVDRVVISVTWSNSNSCSSAAACSYTVASIIDPASDPQFRVYILRANDDIMQDPCTVSSPTSYSCVTQLAIATNDQGKFGVNSLHQAVAPAHGSVNWYLGGGNPAVSYTPTDCTATTNAFSGLDTFQYNATDIQGNTTNNAKVSVTVVPPAAPTLGTGTPTWSANASATGGGISLSAVPSGSVGAWCAARSAVTGLTPVSAVPAGSSVPLTLSGTGSTSSIVATPPAGWSGKVNFTYTLTDAFGQVSPPLTGTLTVAPTAAPVTSSVNANVTSLANSTSPSLVGVGSSLTYKLVGAPTYGTVTLAGSMVTYTPKLTPPPPSTTSRTDTFSYQVTDAVGQVATSTVTITIVAPTAPLAKAFKLATCPAASGSTTYNFAASPYNAFATYYNGLGTTPVTATVGSVKSSSVSVSGSTVTYKTGTTKPVTGNTLFTFSLTDGYSLTSSTVSVTC